MSDSRSGASPQTWPIWTIALLPLLTVVAALLFDAEGYLRALLAAAVRGGTEAIPPSLAGYVTFFAVLGGLGLLTVVAFVVLARLDWSILLRRGVDRPFHWAWSFFVLLSPGALVYLIGRTVVAHSRTGRSASAPLWVWILLTVAGVTVWIVRFAVASAAYASLFASVAGAP